MVEKLGTPGAAKKRNNNYRRVAQETLDKVRAARAAGKSFRAIAKEFNLPPGSIWYYVKGRDDDCKSNVKKNFGY